MHAPTKNESTVIVYMIPFLRNSGSFVNTNCVHASSVSVYTYGAYGAFIGFVPLIVARLFMYIGKIPVENGTPEETEEEAKEALEEANLLENDQKL